MVIKQYCVKNKKYHLNKLLLNWKKMFYFIYKVLSCMCLLRFTKCWPHLRPDLTWGQDVFHPTMEGFPHVSKVRFLMNISFSIISFMLKKKTAPDDISTQSGVHTPYLCKRAATDLQPAPPTPETLGMSPFSSFPISIIPLYRHRPTTAPPSSSPKSRKRSRTKI